MTIDVSDPEDAKLVTLARAHRARAATDEGAAVRDTDGRTYSGASVSLASLQLTALQAAVAQAATNGAGGLEAAVVVGAATDVRGVDLDAVRDLGGPGLPVFACTPDGDAVARVDT